MSSLIEAAAFDRATEPVLRILSRDQAIQIIDFHGDDDLQRRIEEIFEKANEGELTDEERAEYQEYAQANKFIAVLQAKAPPFPCLIKWTSGRGSTSGSGLATGASIAS